MASMATIKLDLHNKIDHCLSLLTYTPTNRNNAGGHNRQGKKSGTSIGTADLGISIMYITSRDLNSLIHNHWKSI